MKRRLCLDAHCGSTRVPLNFEVNIFDVHLEGPDYGRLSWIHFYRPVVLL